MKKKCCVIGLGYIGLPTSIVTASAGFDVIGVDKNKNIIEGLNNGIVHILEPNLKEEFDKVIENKFFKAQTKPTEADIFIIAVPTPFKKRNNTDPKPDISFVINAVESIIPFLRKDNLVILESTSPVGTTDLIADMIFKKTNLKNNEVYVAYCPERVLPGNILNEIKLNDRVIGGINKESAHSAKKFYSHFCEAKYSLTNTKTAELVKLTENSFRDVNIAFANELSMICSHLNIDSNELIKIANYHPRVNILNPGPGVGGHCIAVDPWFIISNVPDKSNLIRAAREVNNKKTNWVIDQIRTASYEFELKFNKKPLIGCFGITFKPDIDDIRESAAMKIIKELMSQKYNIVCCDPMINSADNLKIKDMNELLNISDICIFLVAHSKFKNLNIENLNFIDFCGITY